MNFIIGMHSGLRWVLLLSILLSLYYAFSHKKSGSPFSKDKGVHLATLILCHLQLIIGLILYIVNKRYLGFQHMDDTIARFLAVEHLLGMLIAILLVTLGYKKAKSAMDDILKHKVIFKWYGIALILILLSIPWPFRGEVFAAFGYF